jgi:hypothetical protein
MSSNRESLYEQYYSKDTENLDPLDQYGRVVRKRHEPKKENWWPCENVDVELNDVDYFYQSRRNT